MLSAAFLVAGSIVFFGVSALDGAEPRIGRLTRGCACFIVARVACAEVAILDAPRLAVEWHYIDFGGTAWHSCTHD